MRRTTATLAVVLSLSTAACGVLERRVPDEIPNPERERPGALKVDQWGVTDGLLSVRVENNSEAMLERADATIVVELADGSSISARGEAPQDLCCTLLDVPPDEDFGLYVDLGERAEAVEQVEVSYSNLTWAPAEATTKVPSIVLGEPKLADTEGSTEVRVDVTADADLETIAAQVFLHGPDGEFLAVVSGRFRCFTADEPRPIVVELYHPVPDGTVVESMVAYPLTTETADAVGSCE